MDSKKRAEKGGGAKTTPARPPRVLPARGAAEIVQRLQSLVGNRAVAAQLEKDPAGGLPPALRSGIERLSGVPMGDVRVSYGSSEPARYDALAFARGNTIHLAPGQERHLAHEAWHTVQQKQGRVAPSIEVNGAPVNDDPGLEREADEMGRRALGG